MLRLLPLLAGLLLPTPLLLMEEDAEHYGRPSSPDPNLRVVLDLPASTSWVAAPFVAVGETAVFGWTREPPAAGDARHHAGIVLTIVERGEDLVMLSGGTGVSSRLAEANAGRLRATCCDDPIPGPGEPGEGGFDVFLADGERLWVVFIGANVDPAVPFEIGLGLGTGELAREPTREGTHVGLVDLVDASYAAGVNLRAGAYTLAGWAAPVVTGFEAERNGFAWVSLHADDDAALDVTFRADDRVVLEAAHAVREDAFAYVLGARSFEAQAFVHDERPLRVLSSDPAWSMAVALFADLDVGGSGSHVHRSPR